MPTGWGDEPSGAVGCGEEVSSSASLARDNCAEAPPRSSTGATSTTSVTLLLPLLAEADGLAVTVPGSPGAACDRSTFASAAFGHFGVGSALPASSACCGGAVPTDCAGTTGVPSSEDAAAVAWSCDTTPTVDNRPASTAPATPTESPRKRRAATSTTTPHQPGTHVQALTLAKDRTETDRTELPAHTIPQADRTKN